MTSTPPGTELPPHTPNCFGCGRANRAGLHIRCFTTEDGVRAHVKLEDWHEGGPGVAHGGIVAAILDDVLGFLMYAVGQPMVTARLEVDYRKPLPLGDELDVTARVTERTERKVWAEATINSAEGVVLAQARALFVRVKPAHFLHASPRALERIADWQSAGDDAGPGPVGV